MQNNPAHSQIDNLDIQILSILMEDATTPYTEIAKRLIISGGTVHVRMKKLGEMGIIRGSNLVIDPQKAGYDICAFLGIFLEKGSQYKDAAAFVVILAVLFAMPQGLFGRKSTDRV